MLFGLLLISGALPQAIILIAGIPFNATLFFFGNTELIGHLDAWGIRSVDLVVTELAVIAYTAGRATLVETAPGVTVEQVLAATESELTVAPQVLSMKI